MSETLDLPLDGSPEPDDIKPIDAAGLRALLRQQFPANQYAMLYEVRDGAGFEARRSADVIMMGLWPSRGCQLEGMEIKISRGDWLREMQKPEKAEAIVQYCDHWWIVASRADIVRPEELPPTWGLMIPGKKGLRVIRASPRLNAQPIDRSFLAAMLKRAVSVGMDSPEVQAAIDMRVKAAHTNVAQQVKSETRRLEEQKANLERAIQAFEEASGVSIRAYSGTFHAGRIGEAVKMITEGRHEHMLKELSHIKRRARDLHEWLTANVPDDTGDGGKQ